MRILVVYLCFLLRFILAQNDTLQHVTAEWRFAPDADPIKSEVASSSDLYEHPPGLYLKVTGLAPTIRAGVFRNMEALRSLTISYVGLKEIQADAFQNLPHLEQIECNSNNLTEIKSGTFENLNLTDLQLESDKIKILEKGAFRNLPRLHRLSLKNNQLEEIEKGVFSNICLSVLNLNDNLISKLEAGVFGDISCGKIYFLDVTLNNNKLKEIQPEVFSHEKIVTLELRQNEISQLRPTDLKNMPMLYNLYLSNNHIKNISDNTFPAALTSIDLSNNEITHISSHAFDGISFLVNVNLKHNQLTKWDPDWFPGSIGRYSSLVFSYNSIEELPDDAFKNIQEIDRLDLGKNRIRNISLGAFRSLQEVRFLLLLNDNDLEVWDERHFATRDDLRIGKMNLRRNRFQCFQGDMKDVFRNVGAVWIEQNPIRVDCLEKVHKYKKSIQIDLYDRFDDGSW